VRDSDIDSLFPTPYPLSFDTLAHSFALPKIASLFFSWNYALFDKNNRGWGTPPTSAKIMRFNDQGLRAHRSQQISEGGAPIRRHCPYPCPFANGSHFLPDRWHRSRRPATMLVYEVPRLRNRNDSYDA
jgi:hypothetical protein